MTEENGAQLWEAFRTGDAHALATLFEAHSTAATIAPLFAALIPAFPGIEFGAHLHTTPATWREKVAAAYSAGCRRFDGAIGGFGGCPMAADELTGNMATENLLTFLADEQVANGLDLAAFAEAQRLAREQVFVN